MRVLIDTVCEQAALIKANIAGRGADKAGDCVLLHILGHIKAQKLDAQNISELFGHFGFADACWPCEEVVADGLLRLAQTGAGKFDRGGERVDRLILAEDHAFERFLEVFEHGAVVFGDVLGRNARNFGDHGLNFFCADGLATLG